MRNPEVEQNIHGTYGTIKATLNQLAHAGDMAYYQEFHQLIEYLEDLEFVTFSYIKCLAAHGMHDLPAIPEPPKTNFGSN